MQRAAGGRQERSSSGRRPSAPRRRGWAGLGAGPRGLGGGVYSVTWTRTSSALLLLRNPRTRFSDNSGTDSLQRWALGRLV